MTITRTRLAKELAHQLPLTQQEAYCIVECYFEVIMETLEAGEDVAIALLGKFKLHDKAARPGRNPATKEPYTISARRTVQFKPSIRLKQKLNLCLPG